MTLSLVVSLSPSPLSLSLSLSLCLSLFFYFDMQDRRNLTDTRQRPAIIRGIDLMYIRRMLERG